MGTVEDTATRLTIILGMPRFNGSVVTLDRATGRARIECTNFFFRSKPIDVALSEIAAVELVSTQSAAYPRVVLASGRRHSLPSSGKRDAEEAVPRMQAFLAG